MGSQAPGSPGRGAGARDEASSPFAPQWEPVQYFNNKIICDLVEEKFKGVISILVSPLLSEDSCWGPGGRAPLPSLFS